MRKAAFKKVFEIASSDPRVLLAVSDVSKSIVEAFEKQIPEQLFVEGIAEGHLIGFAAGLARDGDIVFVNTIASFLGQRAFEQIAINLCLDRANVKLLAQGGGLVYGQQGPTHHALADVALMRTLPNMTVIVPCDTDQTERAIEYAHRTPGPVYVRLAKGSASIVTSGASLDPEKPVVFREPERVAVIGTGIMTQVAIEIANRIPGGGAIGIPFLKPFPHRELGKILETVRAVIVLEEHSEVGGLGSCVCETIVKHMRSKPEFRSYDLGDAFVRTYGKQEELLSLLGLAPSRILSDLESRGFL